MEVVSENYQMSCLELKGVREKILSLPFDIERTWRGEKFLIPGVIPGRDAPPFKGFEGVKKGLASKEGQARMLHELANIELQAMELAFRSFIEYPEAPKEFREQMADLAISESQHLEMCLDEIERLGFKWGDWTVHTHLWKAVSFEDSLLDRLLIVHRYLEASGLDAGHHILARLAGADAPGAVKAVKRIAEEEVGHVLFGSRWYHQMCKVERLDADHDFKVRMEKLKHKLPKRVTAINVELRRLAGFTESEIITAQTLRHEFVQNLRPS